MDPLPCLGLVRVKLLSRLLFDPDFFLSVRLLLRLPLLEWPLCMLRRRLPLEEWALCMLCTLCRRA